MDVHDKAIVAEVTGLDYKSFADFCKTRCGGETETAVFRIPYQIKMEVVIMSHAEKKHIPWLLWPFYALWQLVTFILMATGRLVAILLGIVLLIVGIIISLTVVGAVVGIPLAGLGLLLLVRGLF